MAKGDAIGYRDAVLMLAFRLDMVERMERSRTEVSMRWMGCARSEGRYAVKVIAELTGKPEAVVLADVREALETARRDGWGSISPERNGRACRKGRR